MQMGVIRAQLFPAFVAVLILVVTGCGRDKAKKEVPPDDAAPERPVTRSDALTLSASTEKLWVFTSPVDVADPLGEVQVLASVEASTESGVLWLKSDDFTIALSGDGITQLPACSEVSLEYDGQRSPLHFLSHSSGGLAVNSVDASILGAAAWSQSIHIDYCGHRIAINPEAREQWRALESEVRSPRPLSAWCSSLQKRLSLMQTTLVRDYGNPSPHKHAGTTILSRTNEASSSKFKFPSDMLATDSPMARELMAAQHHLSVMERIEESQQLLTDLGQACSGYPEAPDLRWTATAALLSLPSDDPATVKAITWSEFEALLIPISTAVGRCMQVFTESTLELEVDSSTSYFRTMRDSGHSTMSSTLAQCINSAARGRGFKLPPVDLFDRGKAWKLRAELVP